MKTHSSLLLLLTSLLLMCAHSALAQDPAQDIEQLRNDVQRMEAVDRNPASDPEVRELNRRLLVAKRAQLDALISARIAALRTYQADFRSSISDQQNQELEDRIQQWERMRQSIGQEVSSVTATSALPDGKFTSSETPSSALVRAGAENRASAESSTPLRGASSEMPSAPPRAYSTTTPSVSPQAAHLNQPTITEQVEAGGKVIGMANKGGTVEVWVNDELIPRATAIVSADGSYEAEPPEERPFKVGDRIMVRRGGLQGVPQWAGGLVRAVVRRPEIAKGLTAVMLAGAAASQQAQSFSQTDPSGGFLVGFSGGGINTDKWDCMSNPDKCKDLFNCAINPNAIVPPDNNTKGANPCYNLLRQYAERKGKHGDMRFHFRLQGLFTSAPRAEEAPKLETPTAPTNSMALTAPDAIPPLPNLLPFLASRQSFDIESQAWIDFDFRNGVRLGAHAIWGGTTALNANELFSDENITIENPRQAFDNVNRLILDTKRAVSNADIKHFYETGLIASFFRNNNQLFMRTTLSFGDYQSLKGLSLIVRPGETAFTDPSTNRRFVGRLRIFPTGFNVGGEGSGNDGNAAPLFGMDLNAGRGPDQLKFFFGAAAALKLLGSLVGGR